MAGSAWPVRQSHGLELPGGAAPVALHSADLVADERLFGARRDIKIAPGDGDQREVVARRADLVAVLVADQCGQQRASGPPLGHGQVVERGPQAESSLPAGGAAAGPQPPPLGWI